MRSHLIAVALVVLASVWLGHGERVPARALESVVDAEKAEAWVTFYHRGDFSIVTELHLRGRHFVLTKQGCQSYNIEALGYWEQTPLGVSLQEFWSGQTRVVDVSTWRRRQGSGPRETSDVWVPLVRPEITKAAREPSIAGKQPGDPSSGDQDFWLDHQLDIEGQRIRMVTGLHIHVSGRHLWKGASEAQVVEVLGPPSDALRIDHVDLSYLKWQHGDFVILAAVGPDGDVEEFGLR